MAFVHRVIDGQSIVKLKKKKTSVATDDRHNELRNNKPTFHFIYMGQPFGLRIFSRTKSGLFTMGFHVHWTAGWSNKKRFLSCGREAEM